MTPKPLLFIDQSKLVNPHAPMQAEYHTPTGENQGTMKETTDDQFQQKSDRTNGKKSDVFTDMTIDEKLDYLLTRPPHVPICSVTGEAGSAAGSVSILNSSSTAQLSLVILFTLK